MMKRIIFLGTIIVVMALAVGVLNPRWGVGEALELDEPVDHAVTGFIEAGTGYLGETFALLL